ncbi:MAG: hypothetical protein HY905_16250 [Deltaproteobacteria bacterium]|nr:hypothetical protein [Deltaproteobacteria bacterium]
MTTLGRGTAAAQEAGNGEGEEPPEVVDELWEEAQGFEQRAQLEEAAVAYEGFARAIIGQARESEGGGIDERALKGLALAIQVRIALGQREQAEDDTDFLAQHFGADPRYRRLAAAAFFKVGEISYADRDWAGVAEHYDRYLSDWAKRGEKDSEVRAVMLVAEAYWRMSECEEEASRRERRKCDREREAAYEYAERATDLIPLPAYTNALGEGENEAMSDSQIRALRRENTWNALLEALDLEIEGADAELQRAIRGNKVAEALGQAWFYLGERLIAEFGVLEEATPSPGFDPDEWNLPEDACADVVDDGIAARHCRDRARLLRWEQERLIPRLAALRAKIDEVNAGCLSRILYLDVPQWEIAAANRLGDMYLALSRVAGAVLEAVPEEMLVDCSTWEDDIAARFPRHDCDCGPCPQPSIPEEWQLPIACRAKGAETFSETSPWPVRNAVEAYGYCVETAVREQLWTEYADRCVAALQELEPERYPPTDEVYAPPGLDARHLAVPDLGPDIERLAASTRTAPTPESPAAAAPDAVGQPCTPAEGLRCPRQHIRPVQPPPAPPDGRVVPGDPTMDEHGRYRFHLAPPPAPVP